MSEKKIILTGDRPTGKLHLGHYVGSLKNRVALQDEYDCRFIIADFQVLGDHLDKSADVEKNIREITLDWMSVGMDPEKSVFFIQSQIPELTELHMYFSMLVSVARCQRNPTIKSEIYESSALKAQNRINNISKLLISSEQENGFIEICMETDIEKSQAKLLFEYHKDAMMDSTKIGNIPLIDTLNRNISLKEALTESYINDSLAQMSYGYLGYPVSQAADILLFKANLVPVGEDQVAHIEQTREVARRFNFLFCQDAEPVFPEPDAKVSETPRLPGLDEKPPVDAEGFAVPRKMSKSLDNAIYLSDPTEEVNRKVMAAFTDPTRLRKDDPGHPEKCNIFTYYGPFLPDVADDRKKECANGEIGCVKCKKQLAKALNDFLDPIREKRAELEKDPDAVKRALISGNDRAREIGRQTMDEVRRAVKFDFKSLLSE